MELTPRAVLIVVLSALVGLGFYFNWRVEQPRQTEQEIVAYTQEVATWNEGVDTRLSTLEGEVRSLKSTNTLLNTELDLLSSSLAILRVQLFDDVSESVYTLEDSVSESLDGFESYLERLDDNLDELGEIVEDNEDDIDKLDRRIDQLE